MSTPNKMKTWSAAVVAVSLLALAGIVTSGPQCYAQVQAGSETKVAKLHDEASSSSGRPSPAAPEVPAAVAKELQAMQAHIQQLESQVSELEHHAALEAPVANAVRATRSTPTQVTLTGTVSCAHCQGVQAMHKGYTPFSWALYSVSQGDDVVLVLGDKTYKLQGGNDRLLKFMSAKARVTGRLEGNTLEMETIGRAAKNE